MSSLELEFEDNPFWAGPNSGSCSGASEEKLDMMNPPHVSSSSSPTTTIHQKIRGRKGTLVKNQKADGGGGGGGELDPDHHDELHIWTERERRKKMRNMFSVLHSLIPQLTPKADKSSIVDEAVKYIKTLEQTLRTLQQQKVNKIMMNEQGAPLMLKSQTAEASGESILGDHHHHHHQVGGPISETNNLLTPSSSSSSSFQTWFSPNVVVNMCGESAQISVCSPRKPGLSATIFYILEKHKLHVLSAHISSDHYRCMYMIHAHAGGGADHFPEALSVEDIFKLAAGEMNLWLLSC